MTKLILNFWTLVGGSHDNNSFAAVKYDSIGLEGFIKYAVRAPISLW